MRLCHLAAIALLQVLLSACGSVQTSLPAADTIAPNANLRAQGIPPIPRSVADEAAKYNDFRGHGFVAWHPTRREMLVAHRCHRCCHPVQLHRVRIRAAVGHQHFAPRRVPGHEAVAAKIVVFRRFVGDAARNRRDALRTQIRVGRSEEHTSELQSL